MTSSEWYDDISKVSISSSNAWMLVLDQCEIELYMYMYHHVKEHDMVCVRGPLLLVRVYMRGLGMINGSHDQCFLEDLLLNRGNERERERED